MSQPPVIYAWPMRSDHGSHTYEVIMRADGSLSCECAGWCFARKGKPRGCKHVTRVSDEAARLYAQHKSGTKLRRTTVRLPTSSTPVFDQPIDPGLARVIRLEE